MACAWAWLLLTLTSIAASEDQAQYIWGLIGEDRCPNGYRFINDEATCEEASIALGTQYSASGERDSAVCNGRECDESGCANARLSTTHGHKSKWVCKAAPFSCPSTIIVMDAELAQSEMTGSYTRTTDDNASRTIWKNDKDHYLYFWAESGNWLIGKNTSEDVGGMFTSNGTACPLFATGWQRWNGSAWSSAPSVTMRAACETFSENREVKGNDIELPSALKDVRDLTSMFPQCLWHPSQVKGRHWELNSCSDESDESDNSAGFARVCARLCAMMSDCKSFSLHTRHGRASMMHCHPKSASGPVKPEGNRIMGMPCADVDPDDFSEDAGGMSVKFHGKGG